MAASPEGGGASSGEPSHDYKLVSATYLDKTYPDGILRVADSGGEIELRQWTGKKKMTQTEIARFRLEQNAEVLVDGALLRVSELSLTLESPGAAAEVADTLGRPAREREAVRLLSEAESFVSGFLETREQALNLLSWMRVDPRSAMFSVESMWTASDTEPLDAVYSNYSARLAESLGRMSSTLAGGETKLGKSITDRLYALAYTIGAVQNALFDGDSDLAPELAALQEFGIATTEKDLRMEKPASRLMRLAHPELVAMATARPKSR